MIWVTFGCLVCSSVAGYHFGSLYRDSVSFIIVPVLTAVLMVQGIAHHSGALGSVFNWRPVRYLGVISYSIYLYHQIAVHAAENLTRGWPVLSPLAGILAVIAVASASYWLVEKPAQSLKTRLSRDKKQPNVRANQVGDPTVVLSYPPAVASAFSASPPVARSPGEAKG
jgi:peptidoglycan/LPS O-acetylase OafA/YrhL